MDVDYIKNKVDFYKKYQSDYETFYDDEVEPSNEVVSSSANSAGELQRKVRNIRTALGEIKSTLNSDWTDTVEGNFSNYITSCDDYLKNIEDSVGTDLVSAEECYKQLNTLLLSLQNQNTAYQNRWDEMPHKTDSKYTETVSAGTDERGIWHDSYTYQNGTEYFADYNQWESDVTSLAGECITTISQIEPLITNLIEINGNTIDGLDASSGTSIEAPVFEFDESLIPSSLGLTGTVRDYVLKNNLPYVIVNRGGRDYYVLANISYAGKQGADQCLSYANAYARGISEYNGYNLASNGNGGLPYLYSSSDPNEIYQIAASEYVNGRSVTLEVSGKVSTNSRHFVALAGFAADADFSNLKQSDILIIDPTSSNTVGYKVLGTDIGGQRRTLKSAREMQNNSFNTDYAINVFSNVDYANELENTRLASTGATQAGAGSGAIKFAKA